MLTLDQAGARSNSLSPILPGSGGDGDSMRLRGPRPLVNIDHILKELAYLRVRRELD
jgi:hypothetical protein